MRARLIMAVTMLALAAEPALAQRQYPYFGSIAAGKARMRVGPGREYPSSWMYQRVDLPVKVLAMHKGWKRIEDPDGTQGWMQANLLSNSRTALVTPGDPAVLRDRPRGDGRVMWRAAPGVVGRISKCADGWCRLDVGGRGGFVEVQRLWGVAPNETID